MNLNQGSWSTEKLIFRLFKDARTKNKDTKYMLNLQESKYLFGLKFELEKSLDSVKTRSIKFGYFCLTLIYIFLILIDDIVN